MACSIYGDMFCVLHAMTGYWCFYVLFLNDGIVCSIVLDKFHGFSVALICVYREPRGFGFVKYRYAEDAAKAKQRMNHKVIGGREIRIVFAEENRKTPQEMRVTTRVRCGNNSPDSND